MKPKKKSAPKRRPVQKKSLAAKAKTKPKVKAKAKPKTKAKPTKKPAPRTTKTVSSPAAQRQRSISRERAITRDVDNEPTKTSMADSPEYMPEAMQDSLAEELGEAAVASETSGDQEAENIRDEDLEEEEGGPFVETSARTEFADDTDASNPEDAEREPFPLPNARRK